MSYDGIDLGEPERPWEDDHAAGLPTMPERCCEVDGQPMTRRADDGLTDAQRWLGTWWDCPQCGDVDLTPSSACLDWIRDPQAPADLAAVIEAAKEDQ